MQSTQILTPGVLHESSAFREDCIKLLDEFETVGDLSFHGFCKIWKKLKFKDVFWPRPTVPDLRSFCHKSLAIANDFLSPTETQNRRLGAIYLLYGLWSKAPMKNLKIRMTINEWENLMSFRDTIYESQEFEAVFILNKLIKKQAFAFCILKYERGLERNFTGKLHQTRSTFMPIESTNVVEIRKNLANLSKYHNNYTEIKKQLANETNVIAPTIYDNNNTGDLIVKLIEFYKSGERVNINVEDDAIFDKSQDSSSDYDME